MRLAKLLILAVKRGVSINQTEVNRETKVVYNRATKLIKTRQSPCSIINIPWSSDGANNRLYFASRHVKRCVVSLKLGVGSILFVRKLVIVKKKKLFFQ